MFGRVFKQEDLLSTFTFENLQGHWQPRKSLHQWDCTTTHHGNSRATLYLTTASISAAQVSPTLSRHAEDRPQREGPPWKGFCGNLTHVKSRDYGADGFNYSHRLAHERVQGKMPKDCSIWLTQIRASTCLRSVARAQQKVVNYLSQYVFMGLLTEQLKTFLHSIQFLGGYNVHTVDASINLLTEGLGPQGVSGTARDRIPPYHCDSRSQAFLTIAARISSPHAAIHPAGLPIFSTKKGPDRRPPLYCQ